MKSAALIFLIFVGLCSSTSIPVSVCGATEVWQQCASACEPTCENPYPKCTKECGPAKCQCAPGFVRDNTSGKCIAVTSCSGPPVCQVGEVFSTCSTKCEPTCQNPNPICIASCGPAKCQCAAGLVRNSSGKCVAPTSCSVTPVCQVGEVFSNCSAPCEPTCLEPKPTCVAIACGPPKCQCAPGFVRGSSGKCILPTSCSVNPVCQVGEIYSTCSTACEATCENPYPICTKQCGPAKCQCAPGFVRDSSGKCIAVTSCSGPPVCQVGEVYSTCSTACEPTCLKPNPICIASCGPAKCQCAAGLVRNSSGKCVAPTSCSVNPVCQVGEVWMECASACEATCEKPNPLVCTLQCLPAACQCAPGFVRDKTSGKCILPTSCSVNPVCQVGEVYSNCSTPCEPTCLKPNPICIASCGPAKCQCAAGLVRNSSGKCVAPTSCSVNPVCQVGEVWMECASACEATCEKPNPLVCTLQCLPAACQCAPGFVRDKTSGKCILPTSCSVNPVCQVGEVYSNCSTPCEPTCLQPNPTCVAMCGPPKCQCAPGFVRDSSGKCILPTSCSVNPVCQVGEIYSTCSTACEATCENPYPICTKQCGPAKCQCAPGFVRDSSGKCIAVTSCSVTPVCQVGEVFSNCSAPCEPTCLEPKPTCVAIACGPPKCQCAPGFVRGSSGKCILPTSCSVNPVCQVGEIYSTCSTACEATCENPYPICTKQCGPAKCQCAPGFVRDSSGKCIAVTSCSGPPVCQVGEVYSTCSTACEPTCLKPNPICIASCGPAKCQCAAGLVRNSSGKCVAPTSCSVNPVCQVGEVWMECASACEATCEKPNPLVCTLQCLPAACQCAPGFVRDKTSGKCILPTSCSVNPVCQVGEVYSNCSTPCEPTCLQPNPTCVAMCGPPKCQCAPGFVRDSSGKCILPTSCSVNPVCQVGEIFSTCSTACEATCENPYPICTKQCGPAKCQCAPGFVRDSSGKCIAVTSCSGPPVCQVGEVYSSCSAICEPTCQNPNPICIKQCGSAKCECAPGLIRDQATGRCVLQASCSSTVPSCPVGEHWSQCSSHCESTCSNKNPICTKVCSPAKCACNTGLSRHPISGKCVSSELCPSAMNCGLNEEFSECGARCQATCDYRTGINRPQICPAICMPGCVCSAGHIRFGQVDGSGGVCLRENFCVNYYPKLFPNW